MKFLSGAHLILRLFAGDNGVSQLTPISGCWRILPDNLWLGNETRIKIGQVDVCMVTNIFFDHNMGVVESLECAHDVVSVKVTL